ncbi:MAG: hypothetical protein LUQ37_08230 [Methanoregulaceae archaeon]|jgi:hypothetical protein|nr:hypothetical protein [Methanoregulaceae archaeon]
MGKLFSAKTLAVVLWVLFFLSVIGEMAGWFSSTDSTYCKQGILGVLAVLVSFYVDGQKRVKNAP